MASNNGWGPFLLYWATYCKDAIMTLSTSGQDIKFSEGLLTALCYETDVGCIPRGMKLDTAGDKPIYLHSNNWNKQIEGCYWCRDDYNDLNGICCSKECFFYLHDWCVERVHYFTNRRFCRLLGCETNTINDNLYCCTIHKAKFDSEFPKGSDHQALLITVIREGPTWYCPNENIPTPPHVTPQQKSNSTSQNTKQPSTQNIFMPQVHSKYKTNDTSTNLTQIIDFPTDLHNAMIFKTDIGIIPRTPLKEHHLTSPYSSSDNWLREIEGCYWCGNKSTVIFCRYRCYLVFYEWCRMKVHSFTGINMCRNTGCNKTAAEGSDCCTREHSLAIEDKYSKVKKIDIERLTTIGPCWYKKCDVSQSSIHLPSQSLHLPSQSLHLPSQSLHLPSQSLQHNSPNIPMTAETVVDNQSDVKEPCTSPIKLDITKNNITSTETEEPVSVLPSDYCNPFLETISAPQEVANILTDVYTNSSMTSYNDVPHTGTSFTQDQIHDLKTDSSIYSRKDFGLHNTFSHSILDSHINTINQPVKYPFTLSRKLTSFLAQHTDVGIIPRNKYQQQSIPVSEYSTHNNWRTNITGCYWCELSNTSFHELTCGRRCWLLFHEWCVRKLETSCGAKLCTLPGCENSRAAGCACCSLEHIRDICELRGNFAFNTEEEVELILGPKWYSDLSPIYFSRIGAFYEFSIYFPSLLILQGSIWPTVYHYLCAQKLIGTPYSNRICRMECISELERWMKRRTCEKWVRPDWGSMLERTTYRAVLAKFQQNSLLKGLLIKTGMRPLVCRDSSLGDLLVSLREGFKSNRFYTAKNFDVSFNSLPKVVNLKFVSKASLPEDTQKNTDIIPLRKIQLYSSSDDSDSDDFT